MAYEAAQIKVGNFTASADLSSKQFHFVKMSYHLAHSLQTA